MRFEHWLVVIERLSFFLVNTVSNFFGVMRRKDQVEYLNQIHNKKSQIFNPFNPDNFFRSVVFISCFRNHVLSNRHPCQTIRLLTTNLRYKAESNTPAIFDTELRSYSNGITVCIRPCMLNMYAVHKRQNYDQIRTVVSIDLGIYR